MKPHPEDGRLSVDLRRLLPDSANPMAVLEGVPGSGLAEFQAAAPRANGLEVEHTPLEENVAHADIRGFEGMSRNEAKRAQKGLAEAAAWIRMPAGALDGA